MARLRRPIAPPALLAGLIAWCLALPAAQAQQARSEPSAAERCLKLTDEVTDAGPEYPFEAFKRGTSGRVKVELEFTLPDKAPSVKVLEASAEVKGEQRASAAASDFETAVRAFARHYRVPCLTPSEVPARFSVEYVFRPDRRQPEHGQPTDLERAERAALWRCVRHSRADAKLEFPVRAFYEPVQGRVLARLRFPAADEAPEVELYARPGARRLADAVREWVTGLRLPCHRGGTYETTLTYVFVIEGDAYGFKPGIGFRQLLATMPVAVREKMPRDTTPMGCPFDIRLTYTRPQRDNDVDVLSPWNPARKPFLDWLRTVELVLPEESLDSVFGDSVVFTVPCLKIQPTP